MSEVINVSCSQLANHVTTHLYNVQESHIPYQKPKPGSQKYDNHIFLNNFRVNGMNNYSPRAILVDFLNGMGSYTPFEYTEKVPDPLLLVGYDSGRVISTEEKVAKNDFQRKLDNNETTQKSDLSISNTKYWSDYNKLIYKPLSTLPLSNWNWNPNLSTGTNRNFPNLKFSDFAIGKEEFERNQKFQEDMENNFRKMLENCDWCQGFNLFADLNSGWSGFSNEMLVQLKDEFFNNGTINKFNIWTHGFINSKQSGGAINKLSQIKSIVELSKNSSLLFPLDSSNVLLSSIINTSFNANNYWHLSSVYATLINSIWGINCQLDRQVAMSQMENDLSRGCSRRNIVNEIKLSYERTPLDAMDLYNNPNLQDSIDLSLSHEPGNFMSRSIISSHKSPEELKQSYTNEQFLSTVFYNNDSINQITNIDTFPDILTNNAPFTVEMAQTSSLKNQLKSYLIIVANCRLPQHMTIIDDKAELIEDISVLQEEYTVGYDDSDEEYDI